MGVGWLLSGCSQTSTSEPVSVDDEATIAALQNGEDGSDQDTMDASEDQPTLEHDCTFAGLRKHVLATYDTNGDGKLDAS
ncbi:MAG TPA: hypothetical protein VHM19_11680, partial [Polyangiales bacterium]|nr:hypothetical protein [Polyangiales bacterium]